VTDYRDLKPASGQAPWPKEDKGQATRRRDWWRLKGREAADAIGSDVTTLQKAQSERMRQQVIASRLYGNTSALGSSSAYGRLHRSMASQRERITYNAVQEIVDTLVSRVGETKPRPYFLTSGGSYRQQRKAKKLNQWVEGVFYEQKVYDLGLEAFRDAAIGGDGFLYVYAAHERVCVERVHSSELWVDEVEAQYGRPRTMYRVKAVDREELAAAWPKFRGDIMQASALADGSAPQTISDMVTVVEAWHLGTEDDDGEVSGGRHALALLSQSGSGVLLGEPDEWCHPVFPFARISWCRRQLGYWSQGLAEQLRGDQLELNYELQLIQSSMRLAGSFKILRQAGSKVVKEHLSNEVGAIIDYVGTPPQYVTVQPLDPVYFQNVQTIVERMRNRAGVNAMWTHGTKPQGLNSGVAIREMEDVESDRHRTTQRANDNLYLETAALVIAIGQEAASAGKLRAVRVPGKTSFATIDWAKDIKLVKSDEFVMQCFPVSRLPRDPAGRLQTIQEYIQAGMITPRQGKRALDFPDIDGMESLSSAQEDLITRNLDSIIDDAEFHPPEPTDDLELSAEMVLEYIQRYRLLDLEDDKLELLYDYQAAVATLLKLSEPPAPPPGAGGAPLAAPEPTPQSDLVPNTAAPPPA
jgi:hypothetical protein